MRLRTCSPNYPTNKAVKPWELLSEQFAREAKGRVNAWVGGASPQSVWSRVELPVLLQNSWRRLSQWPMVSLSSRPAQSPETVRPRQAEGYPRHWIFSASCTVSTNNRPGRSCCHTVCLSAWPKRSPQRSLLDRTAITIHRQALAVSRGLAFRSECIGVHLRFAVVLDFESDGLPLCFGFRISDFGCMGTVACAGRLSAAGCRRKRAGSPCHPHRNYGLVARSTHSPTPGLRDRT